MLETNLFGRPPGEIDGFDSKLISSEREGTMLIQHLVRALMKGQRLLDSDLLMYLPAGARKRMQTLLFDLHADPRETKDLAREHPDVVNRSARS